MTAQHSVGWIGTGRMGHAMATRLLAAGQDVHVWNRTRAKAEDLAAHGATVVDDGGRPGRPRRRLHHGGRRRRPARGDPGRGWPAAAGEACPRTWWTPAPCPPETSDRIRRVAAERGTTLLAAPVSGNAKVVRAGKLSIAVSGPEDAFHEVEPLLRLIGASVTYVGTGRRRAAGEAGAQHPPRRGDPVARRDHRAGRAGRRLPIGVPGVHQRVGARIGLQPVQDARPGQPRPHADLHDDVAAQGLRPRAGRRPRSCRCRCRSPPPPTSWCRRRSAAATRTRTSPRS